MDMVDRILINKEDSESFIDNDWKSNFFVSLLDLIKFEPIVLGPSTWIQHTPFAYWFMKIFNPGIFVELGTHYGVSYFSFCKSVKDNDLSTKCYAVDNWLGDYHAGFYEDEVFNKVSEYNKNNFSFFSSILRLSFDEAVNYFSDKSIDMLHIDGYHTYESVKHDLEAWLPKMAPGAVILFHDINVRERNFGVWKLFEELKKEFDYTFEFYHGYGLGLIQISKSSKSFIFEFMAENAQIIRNHFAFLGRVLEEKINIQSRLTQVENEFEKKLEIHKAFKMVKEEIRNIAIS
ncbi:MAG: class I SAM-dependent methyltransferase [Nanopusillaceae archaeon]